MSQEEEARPPRERPERGYWALHRHEKDELVTAEEVCLQAHNATATLFTFTSIKEINWNYFIPCLTKTLTPLTNILFFALALERHEDQRWHCHLGVAYNKTPHGFRGNKGDFTDLNQEFPSVRIHVQRKARKDHRSSIITYVLKNTPEPDGFFYFTQAALQINALIMLFANNVVRTELQHVVLQPLRKCSSLQVLDLLRNQLQNDNLVLWKSKLYNVIVGNETTYLQPFPMDLERYVATLPLEVRFAYAKDQGIANFLHTWNSRPVTDSLVAFMDGFLDITTGRFPAVPGDIGGGPHVIAVAGFNIAYRELGPPTGELGDLLGRTRGDLGPALLKQIYRELLQEKWDFKKKTPFLWGPPNAGKTSMISWISCLKSKTFRLPRASTFTLSQLPNSSLFIADEFNPENLTIDLLKQLLNHSTVNTNIKYKAPLSFTADMPKIFMSNDKPVYEGDSDNQALEARFNYIYVDTLDHDYGPLYQRFIDQTPELLKWTWTE